MIPRVKRLVWFLSWIHNPTNQAIELFFPQVFKANSRGHLWNHHIKWTKQAPFYFLPQSLPSLCWRGEAKITPKIQPCCHHQYKSIENPIRISEFLQMVVSIFMWKKPEIKSFTCFPSSIIGGWLFPRLELSRVACCQVSSTTVGNPCSWTETRHSQLHRREGVQPLVRASCCFVKRAMVNSLYI